MRKAVAGVLSGAAEMLKPRTFELGKTPMLPKAPPITPVGPIFQDSEYVYELSGFKKYRSHKEALHDILLLYRRSIKLLPWVRDTYYLDDVSLPAMKRVLRKKIEEHHDVTDLDDISGLVFTGEHFLQEVSMIWSTQDAMTEFFMEKQEQKRKFLFKAQDFEPFATYEAQAESMKELDMEILRDSKWWVLTRNAREYFVWPEGLHERWENTEWIADETERAKEIAHLQSRILWSKAAAYEIFPEPPDRWVISGKMGVQEFARQVEEYQASYNHPRQMALAKLLLRITQYEPEKFQAFTKMSSDEIGKLIGKENQRFLPTLLELRPKMLETIEKLKGQERAQANRIPHEVPLGLEGRYRM